MNGFWKQARAAFQENLAPIDASRDPVTYSYYAGMVSLVSGLEVELGDIKARLARIDAELERLPKTAR